MEELGIIIIEVLDRNIYFHTSINFAYQQARLPLNDSPFFPELQCPKFSWAIEVKLPRMLHFPS